MDVLLQKSTKKLNAVHERSLQIIRNNYGSLYSLLLEETHQITCHQRCINYLTEVYKYLNDVFKLRENTYNLRNFHIFQTKNPRSLKYGLDAIPYRASQLWQQVPTDICEAASLTLQKIASPRMNVASISRYLLVFYYKLLYAPTLDKEYITNFAS